MSNVYEVQHRILRERLQQAVATAEQEPDDEYWRLALLCLALLTGTRSITRDGAGTAEGRGDRGGDGRGGARCYQS